MKRVNFRPIRRALCLLLCLGVLFAAAPPARAGTAGSLSLSTGSVSQGGSVTLRVSNGQGASGDGTIRDPNVADGSVTGHHHTWVAWQDGKWICTVCNAVK